MSSVSKGIKNEQIEQLDKNKDEKENLDAKKQNTENSFDFLKEHFVFEDKEKEKLLKTFPVTNLKSFFNFLKSPEVKEHETVLKSCKNNLLVEIILTSEISTNRKRELLFFKYVFKRKIKMDELNDLFIKIINSGDGFEFYLEFLCQLFKSNKQSCKDFVYVNSSTHILIKFLERTTKDNLEISKKIVYCEILLSLAKNILETFVVFPQKKPVNYTALVLIDNIKDFMYNYSLPSNEARFFEITCLIVYHLLRKDSRSSWKKCFNICEWKINIDTEEGIKEKKVKMNDVLLRLLQRGNKNKLNYNVFMILKLNLSYEMSKTAFFQKLTEDEKLMLKELGKEFNVSFFDEKEFFEKLGKMETMFSVSKNTIESLILSLDKNIMNKEIVNYPNSLFNMIYYKNEINYGFLKKYSKLIDELYKKSKNESTSVLDNYKFVMFGLLFGKIIFLEYSKVLKITSNSIEQAKEIRKKKKILLKFMNYFVQNEDLFSSLYFINGELKLLKIIVRKDPTALSLEEIKFLLIISKKENTNDYFPLKDLKSFYFSNFDNRFIYKFISNLVKYDNKRNEWKRFFLYQLDFLTILLNLEVGYLKKYYQEIAFLVTKVIQFDKTCLNKLSPKEFQNLILLTNIEKQVGKKPILHEILEKEKGIKNFCCNCDKPNATQQCSRCKIAFYCRKKHKNNCGIASFIETKKKVPQKLKKKIYKRRKVKGKVEEFVEVEEVVEVDVTEENEVLDKNLDYEQAKKLKISDLKITDNMLDAKYVLHEIIPKEKNEVYRSEIQKELTKFFSDRGCELYLYGSFSLGVYLNESDLDFTLFLVDSKKLKNDCPIIEYLGKIIQKELKVSSLQMINSKVPIIKFLYKDIYIDLSFQKLNCLNVLPFFEKISQKIGKNYLFKKSVILIKNYLLNELAILNAKDGFFNSYTLTVLILAVFNLNYDKLTNPMSVLRQFIEYYNSFDWSKICVTIFGNVKKSKYGNITKIFESNKKQMISYAFCEEYRITDTSFNIDLGLVNIIDPLNFRNNLGQTIKIPENLEIIKKKLLTANINMNMAIKDNDIRLLFKNTLKNVSDKDLGDSEMVDPDFEYIFKKDLKDFEKNLNEVQKLI